MSRIAYLILISLLSIAILNSYLSVSGQVDAVSHWQAMKTDLAALQINFPGKVDFDVSKRDEARTLALSYWQNGENVKAEEIYLRLWKFDDKKKSATYDEKYISDANELAELYEERCAYDSAFYCRQSVLDYDNASFPANDPHIARDLNNFAVTLHLAGMSGVNSALRKQYYEKAEGFYKRANEIWKANSASQANVAFNLRNQGLVLRELGRGGDSRRAYDMAQKIMDEVNHAPLAATFH